MTRSDGLTFYLWRPKDGRPQYVRGIFGVAFSFDQSTALSFGTRGEAHQFRADEFPHFRDLRASTADEIDAYVRRMDPRAPFMASRHQRSDAAVRATVGELRDLEPDSPLKAVMDQTATYVVWGNYVGDDRDPAPWDALRDVGMISDPALDLVFQKLAKGLRVQVKREGRPDALLDAQADPELQSAYCRWVTKAPHIARDLLLGAIERASAQASTYQGPNPVLKAKPETSGLASKPKPWERMRAILAGAPVPEIDPSPRVGTIEVTFRLDSIPKPGEQFTIKDHGRTWKLLVEGDKPEPRWVVIMRDVDPDEADLYLIESAGALNPRLPRFAWSPDLSRAFPFRSEDEARSTLRDLMPAALADERVAIELHPEDAERAKFNGEPADTKLRLRICRGSLPAATSWVIAREPENDARVEFLEVRRWSVHGPGISEGPLSAWTLDLSAATIWTTRTQAETFVRHASELRDDPKVEVRQAFEFFRLFDAPEAAEGWHLARLEGNRIMFAARSDRLGGRLSPYLTALPGQAARFSSLHFAIKRRGDLRAGIQDVDPVPAWLVRKVFDK
jgi:hypothetical protein